MAVKSFSTATLTRLVNDCNSVSSALSSRISNLESSAPPFSLPNGLVPGLNSVVSDSSSFIDYIKSVGSRLTSALRMFYRCSNLTSVDFSGCDLSAVTNMAEMFCYCSNLTSVDFSGCDLSAVTSLGNMFSYCTRLTSLKWGGSISGTPSNNSRYSLDLYDTKLTSSAANTFFDSLSTKTVSGTVQIRMPSTASGAYKSIATRKGYIITGI